jgi:branched-chain amino acid aminotransferase
MKAEAIKKYYIINGELKDTNDLEIFNKIHKPPIYEVIRVIKGVPLFLEDHLERMFQSANIINYSLDRSEAEIKKDIRGLIQKNEVNNLNIKLISADVEETGKVFLAYFIESFYPPEEYYKEGIHTILFHYERENPNAKVLISSFKEQVSKELKEKGAFEALLVNKDGYIPEGSRSNMFFVKGDKVYTAPKGNVLLGITRKHILSICNRLNVKVIEENIHVEDLNSLDGGFMSGTSVNVLPIATIDNIKIDSINNKIIKEINNAYIREIEKYISSYNEKWM